MYQRLINEYPELGCLVPAVMNEAFSHRTNSYRNQRSRGNPILAEIGETAILMIEQLANENRFDLVTEFRGRVNTYVTPARLAEIGRALGLIDYVMVAIGTEVDDEIITTAVKALMGAVIKTSFKNAVSLWRKWRVLSLPDLSEWEVYRT